MPITVQHQPPFQPVAELSYLTGVRAAEKEEQRRREELAMRMAQMRQAYDLSRFNAQNQRQMAQFGRQADLERLGVGARLGEQAAQAQFGRQRELADVGYGRQQELETQRERSLMERLESAQGFDRERIGLEEQRSLRALGEQNRFRELAAARQPGAMQDDSDLWGKYEYLLNNQDKLKPEKAPTLRRIINEIEQIEASAKAEGVVDEAQQRIAMRPALMRAAAMLKPYNMQDPEAAPGAIVTEGYKQFRLVVDEGGSQTKEFVGIKDNLSPEEKEQYKNDHVMELAPNVLSVLSPDGTKSTIVNTTVSAVSSYKSAHDTVRQLHETEVKAAAVAFEAATNAAVTAWSFASKEKGQAPPLKLPDPSNFMPKPLTTEDLHREAQILMLDPSYVPAFPRGGAPDPSSSPITAPAAATAAGPTQSDVGPSGSQERPYIVEWPEDIDSHPGPVGSYYYIQSTGDMAVKDS